MSAENAAETAIPAGTWSIDPPHSFIEFAIKHVGIATVKGYAIGIQGTIEGGVEPAVRGIVDATTLTTHDETRDAHLRSPEFFDVERFPQLSFESTDIEERDGALVVHGTLTIKGVSQPVELRGRYTGSNVDPWGNDRIGLEFQGTVDRTAFGLNWNAPLPGGGFLLPNDVALSAGFSAIKEA